MSVRHYLASASRSLLLSLSLSPSLIISLIISLILPPTALAQDVPPYLQMARELLHDVAPQDNSYRYNGWIRIKGDKFLFDEVHRSEVHTDCSGLIDALLERTEPQVLDAFKNTHWKSYPKAANYYEVIAAGQGFVRRSTITDVEVGNIFAAKFTADIDTGHVMLVDAKPRRIENPVSPILPDTQQWEIVVIDSSSSSHGKNDTRHRSDGTRQNGIGRGSVRVYTDATGQLLGWVMTLAPRDRLRSSGELAIGKPVL